MESDHQCTGELREVAAESLSPLLGSSIQAEALTLCPCVSSVPSVPLASTALVVPELDSPTLLPSLASDMHGHCWQSQGCSLLSDAETSALLA